MRLGTPLLVAILGQLSTVALAQTGPEPPAFKLPAGARVRLTTTESRSIVALLARHDAVSVTLALPSENPLATAPELVVPSGSITRVEVSLGKKRHTLIGALLGAVILGATGFSDPVDTSDSCSASSSAPCSRGEAVAIAALGGALLGGVVGHLVQTERWVPVALDALRSPVAGEGRVQPRVRASADGLKLGVSVRF